MGLGFPAAIGFALAKKLKGEEGTVYCLMSDGEMQIGTTWEAVLIAGQQKLDNLVIIIDNNGFQAMGKIQDILPVSFFNHESWDISYINGHDFASLEAVLEIKGKKPQCIVAQTTKGKDVSFMENNNLWHYKAPNQEEYEAAMKELCLK